MWNSRVTLTVMVSLLGLVLLCSLLGAAYAPYYGDRWDARLTQNAIAGATHTAVATQAEGATHVAHLPTLTAVAGATQTEVHRPTATPTPTNTPTPTPPAAFVECAAAVTGSRQLLYPVPGGGQLRDAVRLNRDTAVTILARLEDQGWLQVRAPDGTTGWMRSQDLEPRPAGCQANIYDLSYLLGMAEGREVVADDTLISNENAWVDGQAEPLSPVLGPDGDAMLVLNTRDEGLLRPSSERLQSVPVFDLATSFSRVNFVNASYVGVRFRANDLTYYEVRVRRNCRVEVYAVTELVFTRPVDPGENTCIDDLDDWLRVSFDEANRLTVQFNDADPFEVHLEDSAGLYTGGGLALVVGHARATFSYVVVTAPLGGQE